MRSLSILAAVCAALTAAPASAYLASNALVVEPRGQGDFFIPYRGKSGAGEFWCAAAEYAEGPLGQPPATRIFRTTAPPRRSGEGIGFSLDPGKSVGETGLIEFGNSNGGLTISHARSLCDNEFLLFR